MAGAASVLAGIFTYSSHNRAAGGLTVSTASMCED